MDKEVTDELKAREWFPEAKINEMVDLDIPDAFGPYGGEFIPEWLPSSLSNESRIEYIRRYKGKSLGQVLREKREMFESYIK
jgi:hypothetical protein